MKYAFHLGTNQALSVAEILSVFPDGKDLEVLGDVATIELAEEIQNPQEQFDLLGGSIRMMRVHHDMPLASVDHITLNELSLDSVKRLINFHDGKTPFGISVLNKQFFEENAYEITKTLNQWGFDLKKELRAEGHSVRFIALKKFPDLPTAAVLGNQLAKNQSEIVLIGTKTEVLVTTTIGIQNIHSYTERDEWRPHRDAKLGMLPIKLAQIMINLSGAKPGEKLLDPFCGLGTVVQEGLNHGIESYGSDSEHVVAKKAQENLEWLLKKHPPKTSTFAIQTAEVSKANAAWNTSFDALVTEGFLGKTFSRTPRKNEIDQSFQNLQSVYREIFKQAKDGLIKQNKRIILSWPYYPTREKNHLAPWLDIIQGMGYTQLDLLGDLTSLRGYEADRKSFLYARPDAHVGREITAWQLEN